MPRRISLSGPGGVGKTELSISIAERQSSMRYILFLRASDHENLQRDLATAALDLRNELLRFESDNHQVTGEDHNAAAFYFSGSPVRGLVNILKRWLKATPDDGSRILVILDDLDGLEPSNHEEYSLMFSGDALDLIYTTRDPSMAELGMLWPAARFDVPALQVSEAADVLAHFSKDNRATGTRSISSSALDTSRSKNDTINESQIEDIATRLGALPAAIVIGSHYLQDKLGSKWNSDCYQRFLDSWDQESGKNQIMNSRRAILKYRHSMLATYNISLQRL